MFKKVLWFLFDRYVFFISSFIFLRLILTKQDSVNREILFVNYRAFGHSLIDSYAVYDFYINRCAILSVGEDFERNPCIEWIIPPSTLIQIKLPSFHRYFAILQKHSLRKYVGPVLVRQLMWAQSCGLISKTTKIEGENAEIMLRLAPYHLEKYIGWSFHKSLEYVKRRENMHRVNGILKSNSVGTQIYASIVDRVLDECINIPIKTEQIFLDYISQHYGSQSIAGINIYTLIISGRGKPHHGNGLERYLQTLSKLLEFDETLVVIVLGDDKHEIQALRSRGDVISRILTPEDFNLDSKTVQFLSIRNSKLVFGDPSGIWTIFLLLGLKGFILDQIPTGEFINRCFHVPRIWKDSMGNCASPDFYLKDSFLRLHSFTNNQGYWDHRLHTSEEIYYLFVSNALSPNLSNSDEELLLIEDELAQYLLANNICQLRLL